MLKAKEVRKYAREALRGRWLAAGGVSLLASLLGATISMNAISTLSFDGEEESFSFLGEILSLPKEGTMFFAICIGIAVLVLLWAIIILILGGATTLGYAKYNLNLVDDKDPKVKDLFSQYNRIGAGFGMQFFRGLFIVLWTLLLVFPGMIARYRYYMTPFILCENPKMKAREAIKESKKLMKGNKWRLFCLEFSFLGWYALAILVMYVALLVAFVPMFNMSLDTNLYLSLGILGVSLLVIIAWIVAMTIGLQPYVIASIAVFYREISAGKYSNSEIEVEAADYVYKTVSNEEIEYIEI